jgi:hypothetical protein
VKNGPRRLFVPNSAFLTREFMVVDDPSNKSKRDLGVGESDSRGQPINSPVWRAGAPFFGNARWPSKLPCYCPPLDQETAILVNTLEETLLRVRVWCWPTFFVVSDCGKRRPAVESAEQQGHMSQPGVQQLSAGMGVPAADAAGADQDRARHGQQPVHSDEGSAGALHRSNGASGQTQQRPVDPASPEQAGGYYYGYDGAPGLPEQYWGYSTSPTQIGYPPGWDTSCYSR